MNNEELIAELSQLGISKKRIEQDTGMPVGNLNKYFKNPSQLPPKWVDKLITYVRLKKDVHLTDWGKIAVENEELKAKIRSLEDEIYILRPAAESWNELMKLHEKAAKQK